MKLTDIQLVMLSRASQRADRGVEIPDTLEDAAVKLTVNTLLNRKLVEAVPRTGDLAIWKTRDDGSPSSLIITPKGRAAIGVDDAEADRKPARNEGNRLGAPSPTQERKSTSSKAPKARRQGRPVDRKPRVTSATTNPRPKATPGKESRVSPRPDTKLGKVVALLRRSKGVSIAEVVKATGWQAHTVRGAIAGAIKRKLGLNVASEKAGEERRYRIVG